MFELAAGAEAIIIVGDEVRLRTVVPVEEGGDEPPTTLTEVRLGYNEIKITRGPNDTHPGLVGHGVDAHGRPTRDTFGEVEIETDLSKHGQSAFAIRILKRVKEVVDNQDVTTYATVGILTGAATAIAMVGVKKHRGS